MGRCPCWQREREWVGFPSFLAAIDCRGESKRDVDTLLITAAVGLVDQRKNVVASLLAPTASVGADAAMLVVLGVPLAFLGADTAGLRARFDHLAGELRLEGGLPRQDATRRLADIRAVEVEPDTADKLLNGRLTEAGVGATGAGRRAADALVDTARERVAVDGRRLRMSPDHLLN